MKRLPSERTICPRCGRRLRRKYDGIFAWMSCPARKACGWDVFRHGQDPRDKREEESDPPDNYGTASSDTRIEEGR